MSFWDSSIEGGIIQIRLQGYITMKTLVTTRLHTGYNAEKQVTFSFRPGLAS